MTENLEIHGIVLLKDQKSFDVNRFVEYLKGFGLQIDKTEIDKTQIIVTISGDVFGVSYFDFPVPEGDIKYAASLTDNWSNAWEELKDQRAHIFVMGFPGTGDQVERFTVLTKLILTLLHTEICMGVYMGNQGLIISTDRYLKAESFLSEYRMPITLWINICMFTHQDKNYIRTMGLGRFGMPDIDLIDSESFEDLYPYVCGIILEILNNRIILNADTVLTKGNSRVTFELAISPLDDAQILRIR